MAVLPHRLISWLHMLLLSFAFNVAKASNVDGRVHPNRINTKACRNQAAADAFYGFNEYCGRSIAGLDLYSVPGADLAACLAACNSDPLCKSVVVSATSTGLMCHIKWGKAAFINEPNYDLYVLSDPTCHQLGRNAIYGGYQVKCGQSINGMDIGNYEVEDRQACLAKCDDTSDCVAAVVTSRNEWTVTCYLKSSSGPGVDKSGSDLFVKIPPTTVTATVSSTATTTVTATACCETVYY